MLTGSMPTRRTLLFAAARLAVDPATADDAAALAFVTAIYDSYKNPSAGPDGVLIDSESKLRNYFEPALAAAMNKDQEEATRSGGVGKLDWDPFIDAQNFDFKEFSITIKNIVPGRANATVTFTNLGKPMTIVLDLISIKKQWRIFDITWRRGGKPATLRELFELKPSG